MRRRLPLPALLKPGAELRHELSPARVKGPIVGEASIPERVERVVRLLRGHAVLRALALGHGVVHVGDERESRRATPRVDDGRQAAQGAEERWIDREPRLARIPLDGGPTRSMIEGVRPWWIVVDERRASWSSGSGALHQIDLAVGTSIEVANGPAGSIAGIAVDEAHIYWVTRDGMLGRTPR